MEYFRGKSMKNICKFLSLILGLSLISQAAHGAALKTSLEAAKNSLSSLANTAAGKALVKHKDKIAAAAWACSVYRLVRYLPGIQWANGQYDPNVLEPLVLGASGIFAYGVLTEGDVGLILTNPLLVAMAASIPVLFYKMLHQETCFGLSQAARNNNPQDYAKFLKGFGPFRPDAQTVLGTLAATQNPAIVRQFIKAGAANSQEGRKALVQAHPQIAQQAFGGRHNALIAQLSQPAKTISKKTGSTITQRLPKSVAAHIASFDTGITVKQPASAATAHTLIVADQAILSNLDEILDAALKELDE